MPSTHLAILAMCLTASASLTVRPPEETIHRGGLSSGSVLLAMVSKASAPSSLDEQMRGFGRVFQTIVSTEADHRCTLCSDGRGKTELSSQFYDGGMTEFSNMTVGWYCGNQRHLQALAHAVLQRVDVQWVGIAEHDVYVNAPRLLELLSKYDSENQEIAIGNEWGGGAGFFFSKRAIEKFVRPLNVEIFEWDGVAHRPSHRVTVLDSCVMRVLGGQWCHKHADWAIAECVRLAGMHLSVVKSMKQECDFRPMRKGEFAAWERKTVTCHHLRTATELRALDDAIRDLN